MSVLHSTVTDGPLFTSAPRVCGVCHREFSKYKCPRCALQYCSVTCFRGHSQACTEEFYADRARQELQGTRAAPDQQLDMLQKLRQFEANAEGGGSDDDDDDDDDDYGDTAEAKADTVDPTDAKDSERSERLCRLLEQANLNEAQLNDDERAEFHRLLADGSLGAQLQASPAWWVQLPAQAVVPAPSQSLGTLGWQFASESCATAAEAAGAPRPPTALPTMRSLTSRAPSSALGFNMLEVICSYVYTYRLFCAAPDDDPLAAASTLVALSDVFNGQQATAYATAHDALLSFRQAAESPAVATSAAFGAAVLADVRLVLDEAGRVALALGATSSLLDTSAAICKHDHVQACGAEVGRRRDWAGFQRSYRKSRFLEVWWASRSAETRQTVLGGLQFALRKELERRDEIRAAQQSAKPQTAPPVTVLEDRGTLV